MSPLRAWVSDWIGALILAAALVLAALIVVPALKDGTAARASWWLVTTLLIASLAGALVGLGSVRTYWARVTSGEPDKPLTTLAVTMGLGLGLIFWYGWTGPNGSVAVAVLLVSVAVATILVGVFVGFLFGIPRFDYSDRKLSPSAQAGGASDVGAAATAGLGRTRYRPSTNLDEIADWLTKIIVGLGLTQLSRIGPGLNGIANYVVSGCTPECSTKPFVAAAIVFSSVAGFLFGYMWTRLHYAKLAARSDVETDRTLQEIETRSVAEIGIGGKMHTRAAEMLARDDSDPNKGKFGGNAQANGRVLRAAIYPSETQRGLYRVTLTVTSTLQERPLRGIVLFHLHPTFKEPVVERTAVNGVAELTVVAYGAFTVGAVTDDHTTSVELDLAEHPEAPEDFRAR